MIVGGAGNKRGSLRKSERSPLRQHASLCLFFRFGWRINHFGYVGRIFLDVLDQNILILRRGRTFFFHLRMGVAVCCDIRLISAAESPSIGCRVHCATIPRSG